MQKTNEPPRMSVLIRAAVVCALVGLLCVLLFLWSGFTPLSMGVGIMLGFPLLLIAIILYFLYFLVVARDLQRHGLF